MEVSHGGTSSWYVIVVCHHCARFSLIVVCLSLVVVYFHGIFTTLASVLMMFNAFKVR